MKKLKEERNILVYVDIHNHSKKKNIFSQQLAAVSSERTASRRNVFSDEVESAPKRDVFSEEVKSAPAAKRNVFSEEDREPPAAPKRDVFSEEVSSTIKSENTKAKPLSWTGEKKKWFQRWKNVLDENVDCEQSDRLTSVIGERQIHVLRDLGNNEYFDLIANKKLKKVGNKFMKNATVHIAVSGELPETVLEGMDYPVKVFMAQNETQ